MQMRAALSMRAEDVFSREESAIFEREVNNEWRIIRGVYKRARCVRKIVDLDTTAKKLILWKVYRTHYFLIFEGHEMQFYVRSVKKNYR